MRSVYFLLSLLVALALMAGPFALNAEAASTKAKSQPVPKKTEAEKSKTIPDDRAVIARAEKWLGALTTAQARFVQTAHDGTQLVGTFYLSRPGRLRFEYDPPVKDFVVADGLLIYFYDAELKEQTNAPIGQTLADFILRRDLKLSGDLSVKNVKRGGGLTQIELTQASDPAAGSLTLGFTDEPFALKKWRVVDGQGLITEVELFYLKTGVKFPAGLFMYKNPDSKAKLNQ